MRRSYVRLGTRNEDLPPGRLTLSRLTEQPWARLRRQKPL